MRKKLIITSTLLVLFTIGTVFAQSHDYCNAHARDNGKGVFHNNCNSCRSAKSRYDNRQAENRRRLAEQKRRLAQKQQERAAAATVEEQKQTDQEIIQIRIIIAQIEAELN